jgi:Fe-S-cluster containining protein
MENIEDYPEDLKKCLDCGAECCKSVAIELDDPEDLDDYMDLKWYLYHGFTVFQDHEGDWHVDIPHRCHNLLADNRCAVYRDRPPVCRDFEVRNCDNGDDEENKVTFEKPEDVDRHIEKLRAEGTLKPGKVFQ